MVDVDGQEILEYLVIYWIPKIVLDDVVVY